MPKIFLMKKRDPKHPIWRSRKDEDLLKFCGETEEEARQNAANYTQIPGKPFAPSPWKDPKLTSCDMDYAGLGTSV